MRLLIMIFLMFGCGADEDELKKEWEAEKQAEIEAANSSNDTGLYFQGYVQTAFEITVDGVVFNDSEDFYTNFKTDLVYPNYPETVGKSIGVLGKYGHDSFGANTAVFMAPTDNADHLFSSETDKNRHFIVNVEAANHETTYRAKIILRIGLDIEAVKHCYLLHSTLESIVFQEGTPIVFDDFKTQLNAWDCSQDVATPIEIPADALKPTKIRAGLSKADVIAILGTPTSIGSATGRFEYSDSSGKCAAKYGTGCYVTFENDVMTGQENISVEFLQL